MVIARRRPLVEMLTAERNRRVGVSPSIRAEIDEHVAWLTARLKLADRELVRVLRGSPMWRERDDLLEWVPGVRPVLTATLVADLPELGTLSHKQIAALVQPFAWCLSHHEIQFAPEPNRSPAMAGAPERLRPCDTTRPGCAPRRSGVDRECEGRPTNARRCQRRR